MDQQGAQHLHPYSTFRPKPSSQLSQVFPCSSPSLCWSEGGQPQPGSCGSDFIQCSSELKIDLYLLYFLTELSALFIFYFYFILFFAF